MPFDFKNSVFNIGLVKNTFCNDMLLKAMVKLFLFCQFLTSHHYFCYMSIEYCLEQFLSLSKKNNFTTHLIVIMEISYYFSDSINAVLEILVFEFEEFY